MDRLIKELRRRKVVPVAGLYAVVGWLLTQVAGTLEDAVGLPGWFDGLVVSLLLIGFPIAVILAWAFELTPEEVRRTPAPGVDHGPARRAQAGPSTTPSSAGSCSASRCGDCRQGKWPFAFGAESA